jgi:sigma-B regulation protein RsbU (phosphoserine phosphatase)
MEDQLTSSRILVVDDEELNRDLLVRRLGKKGYLVESADGAAQADQQVEQSDYDLILLDIMMPDVDGFQYLKRLRERWTASELPVIMATAKDSSEDIVKALKLGASDYVTKPLDFQVVLARVETQLQLKHTTKQLAEAHRLLKEDLERAASFQRSQLPRPDLSVRGSEFAWIYQPCDALAGDFLNVIPLDDARTAFYVLDVSGHGTPAALLSASVGRALAVTDDESSVVAHVTRKGFMRGNRLDVVSPSEVTARLNRQFEFDMSAGKYFTMAYMILDIDVGELAYTLAGHPPPVLVPADGESRFLRCDGVPVGLLDAEDLRQDSFQEQKVSVAVGDRIFVYSDGLTEAFNDDDEQFGEDRLREAIDNARQLTIGQSVEHVMKVIRTFCGDHPFDDDMSIIAVELIEPKSVNS